MKKDFCKRCGEKIDMEIGDWYGIFGEEGVKFCSFECREAYQRTSKIREKRKND